MWVNSPVVAGCWFCESASVEIIWQLDECSLPGELSDVQSSLLQLSLATWQVQSGWVTKCPARPETLYNHWRVIALYSKRDEHPTVFRLLGTSSRIPFITGYSDVICRCTTVDAACKAQVDENIPVTHKSRHSPSYFVETFQRSSGIVNPYACTVVRGWQALDK